MPRKPSVGGQQKTPTALIYQIYTGSIYGGVYKIAWSPDGSRIAFDDGHHEIEVWNVNPKRHISSYPVHTLARITALTWSSDGKQIASATYDGTIQVWNPATGKNVSSPHTNAGQLISLAWSPDRSHLASATSDGMVQVWITNHNNPPTIRQAIGTVMPVVALSWSPDGSYLAASNAELVQVWDMTTGKKVSSPPLEFTQYEVRRGHSKAEHSVGTSGRASIRAAHSNKSKWYKVIPK